MSARYVKNHSNYLLRKRHQDTIDGRIFEKDWVTIGSKEHYYSRDKKKSYHGDNNFVFTLTNIPTFRKKQHYGDFIAKWTYDDVKDVKPTVNQVIRNNRSNDIRNYAYYGSASELVRASVENIIATFPPYLEVNTSMTLGEWSESDNPCLKYSDYKNRYVINNPFYLDFWHKEIILSDYDEPSHFLWHSWKEYVFTEDGNTYKELQDVPEMKYVWESCNGSERPCYNVELLWEVTIGNTTLYGIQYFDNLVFVTNNTDFKLMPKKDLVENYFNNLEGFENCLLNRESRPYYSNTFLTPKRSDYGTVETQRVYTWVSKSFTYSYENTIENEYGERTEETETVENYDFRPIDIESPKYSKFVMSLAKTAEILDETYCDNIWNRMVHEAIKTYDWSYSRYRDEDLEEQHLIGGNQVEKFLRVYGRGMDDILNLANGIKSTSNITYDGRNNVTDAELSDKLDVKGWEIYSTIPILEKEAMNSLELGVNLGYKGYTTTHITPEDVDNEFMRRFNLVSNRIVSTKGTIESIDMIMALFGLSRWCKDYSVTEEYHTTKPIYDDETDVRGTGKDYETFKSEVANTNQKKYDMILYYENDPFSGIPLKEVYDQNNKMLVPYFNHHQYYDGEMYFQFKGGWGRMYNLGSEKKNWYEYLETMNYMQIYESCQSLFENANNIKEGEIVYVSNMNDYNSFYPEEEECPPASHFMKCKYEDSSTTKDGWEIVKDGDDEYERALYVSELMLDNKGNNPHVGYGSYDLGEEYWKYMCHPFKYAYDEKRLYDISGQDELINRYSDLKFFDISNKIVVEHNDVEDFSYKGKLYNAYYKDAKTKAEISTIDTQIQYDRDNVKPEKEEYILNSKVLTVINGDNDFVKSDDYKGYFKNVIMKYLLQIIPSTTILKIEGFEIEEKNEDNSEENLDITG